MATDEIGLVVMVELELGINKCNCLTQWFHIAQSF